MTNPIAIQSPSPIHHLWVKTLTIGDTTLNESDIQEIVQTLNATRVGAVPTVTGLSCNISRLGTQFTLTFTLDSVSITVTDGAGSGSHGSLKIFDFVETGLIIAGCRQDYTAFAEGAALTGEAGDAVFEIGVGTVAIAAAANGTLGATNDNVGAGVDVTLSDGTGAGTAHTASNLAVDGTGTAADLYLNWSGTAATIDATSTIAVTGTITVAGLLLGDD
jgi:hypothetical protein